MKRPRSRLAWFLLLAANACGPTVVDPDSIDPQYAVGAEYEDWYRLDTIGAVPGHGDSYRIIYVNDIGRLRGTTDADDTYYNVYPEGSIIVKEVRERDGDQPGAVKYLGVMRKMDLSDVPDGVSLHKSIAIGSDGWLFTYLADDVHSDEEYRSSCWDDCHAAAPIDGTFYDYGE